VLKKNSEIFFRSNDSAEILRAKEEEAEIKVFEWQMPIQSRRRRFAAFVIIQKKLSVRFVTTRHAFSKEGKSNFTVPFYHYCKRKSLSSSLYFTLVNLLRMCNVSTTDKSMYLCPQKVFAKTDKSSVPPKVFC
jgi:hypothetical protein